MQTDEKKRSGEVLNDSELLRVVGGIVSKNGERTCCSKCSGPLSSIQGVQYCPRCDPPPVVPEF